MHAHSSSLGSSRPALGRACEHKERHGGRGKRELTHLQVYTELGVGRWAEVCVCERARAVLAGGAMHYMRVRTPLGTFPHHPELDELITSEEVQQTLKRMKNVKSPGLDGIPIEIYKALPTQMWYYIIHLWNSILDKGKMPREWCKGIILPIYKNGNKLQVENYRGITLLPSIMKIFFSILTKRVCEWAESKNIIPVEQFGFRPGHRTTDPIFVLNCLIQRAFAQNSELYCCFLGRHSILLVTHSFSESSSPCQWTPSRYV